MKLINEKSFYQFAAYLVIFTIVGIVSYFTVYTIINLDYKEKLKFRKEYVIKQLNESDSLLTYSKFSGNTLSIFPVGAGYKARDVLSDTIIYDEIDNRYIYFKQLKFVTKANGKAYKIHIRRSLIETDNIIRGLVFLVIVMFLILLISLVLVSKYISNSVWKPFYSILEKIKKYELGKFDKIDFPETDIKEFRELILVLNRLMDKISKDFHTLKEFTENISHEIQTPLSIIKSKLELLLQSEHLNETEVSLVNSSYQSVNKLSKLTEALALLIRIDNHQFSNLKVTDFEEIILNKLKAFQDLVEMKNIKVSTLIQEKFCLTIDPALADILIGNLIVNAIKHNYEGGEISLTMDDSKICLSNTGKQLQTSTSQLFERFSKSNSDSLGLGLSIVKNICTVSNLNVDYTYENHRHTICIHKVGTDIAEIKATLSEPF